MAKRGLRPARWRSTAASGSVHVVDGVVADAVRPASREETRPIALAAVVLAFIALMVCYLRGYILLYGDAVAHLGIARRILDSRNPGLGQLGGVWLPLPHLLMMPFVQKTEWWQNGLAGVWPSMSCLCARRDGNLPVGAADGEPAMVSGGDGVFCAEPELAVSLDDGDDRATVSGAADLADAA